MFAIPNGMWVVSWSLYLKYQRDRKPKIQKNREIIGTTFLDNRLSNPINLHSLPKQIGISMVIMKIKTNRSHRESIYIPILYNISIPSSIP